MVTGSILTGLRFGVWHHITGCWRRGCYDGLGMAKIRPASGKSAPAGPKNPQAISCILLLVLLFALLGVVLYLSISRG